MYVLEEIAWEGRRDVPTKQPDGVKRKRNFFTFFGKGTVEGRVSVKRHLDKSGKKGGSVIFPNIGT